MSRDKGGNGIQEVVGSIPISSTKEIKKVSATERSRFCFRPLCDLGAA